MPDDRPLETPEEHAARLERELNEFKQMMTARISRRPTGDVEATIRTSAKQNTLVCDGALVSRTDYQALWEWATAQGLVGVGGLFTAGDGSTTFKLPDFRGRVLMGMGALGTDTYSIGQLVGSSTVKLGTEHMPAHSHYVVVNNYSHFHAVDVGGVGDHGGHRFGTAPGAAGNNAQWATSGISGAGNHGHGANTRNNDHWHEGRTEVIGGSDGNNQNSGRLENRQPSVAVNYLIWT